MFVRDWKMEWISKCYLCVRAVISRTESIAYDLVYRSPTKPFIQLIFSLRPIVDDASIGQDVHYRRCSKRATRCNTSKFQSGLRWCWMGCIPRLLLQHQIMPESHRGGVLDGVLPWCAVNVCEWCLL